MSTNGQSVSAFERALADYCGARYCVSAANGTATLQAALVAIGVRPGDKVATTALTMAATSIAILNVGATPVYVDVDPATWLMDCNAPTVDGCVALLPVSLYGLSAPWPQGLCIVDDAAQTLRKHSGCGFTSLSFQRSKILSTGEGGALLTDNEDMAAAARSYLSLGYEMRADQARIDSSVIRSPSYARHYRYPSLNARMSDALADRALNLYFSDGYGAYWFRGKWRPFNTITDRLNDRRLAATFYRDAIEGCDWITPQAVPDGWTHDYWTYAIACDTPERTLALQSSVVKHGGEMPYGAWRLTFNEPAFGHLDPGPDACPIARSLQPRLLQFQTNNLTSAEQNATALRKAIKEIG